MRPICHRQQSFSGFRGPLASCNQGGEFIPGLSLPPGVVYNDQQHLPLSGRVPTDHGGASLSFESTMNSGRPDPSSSGPRRRKTVPEAVRNETRAEKLARIKREIEAGTYDSDDKLEQAIERMLGSLTDF